MPATFFFGRPGPQVAGAYARCASFDTGRAAAVAASPDGQLAALVGTDGVARVVDVSSRAVIAVLAPARAAIARAAFSPSGDAILTIAPNEREATLWRVGSWSALWTVSLPGHRYERPQASLAFSPDGRRAALSPGSGVFLVDVASGAILATRPSGDADFVSDVTYAWRGRRIIVADTAITGSCAMGPDGGDVTILASDTLVRMATVLTLGGYLSEDEGVVPALAASPVDDLVLTNGTRADPSVRAFRVSDGSPLPPPPLADLPTAFMPDGASVVTIASGQIGVHRLADGAAIATVPPDTVTASGPAPAIAATDRRIMLAGAGAQLLRVWDITTGAVTDTCASNDAWAVSPFPQATSLSGDGQTLAIGGRSQALVVRRSDGARLGALGSNGDGPQLFSFTLSPDGRFGVATYDLANSELVVFRTADGARVRTIEAIGYWPSIAFAPDSRHLYTVGETNHLSELIAADLGLGDPPRLWTLPGNPIYKGNDVVIGFSYGCPVIFLEQHSELWRSCMGCNDPALAVEGTASTIRLSPGGRFLATADTTIYGNNVALWRMSGAPEQIHQFPPRPLEPGGVHEVPVAVTPDGARLVTGAVVNHNCTDIGPDYELRVQDTATGTLIDTLPPRPSGIDDEAFTLAYGATLWCAR